METDQGISSPYTRRCGGIERHDVRLGQGQPQAHRAAQHFAGRSEQVILNDPLDLQIQSVDGEERFMQVGETKAGRILVVVATWQNNTVRVVTGWDAPATHKQEYLQDRMKTWLPPS